MGACWARRRPLGSSGSVRWYVVIAFRRAEEIHPHRVQRDPFAREVLSELLLRSPRGAVGRELRGMAYRAGLPV